VSVTSVATASNALSLEELRELYAQMVLVRAFETEAERQ
jgi:TPP-dependent pyruvate/acetoin dehydrogenase alpha subunit